MTEVEFEELRILLVEDNPLQQLLITRMLGNVGAHVEVARDGIHALDTLADRNYDVDLIIADINMPNMSGTEFTQKLYMGLGKTGIPVIGMLSGYLFHPTYEVRDTQGELSYHVKKQPAFLEGIFTIEESKDSPDDILVLLSILMMALLERQRG